MKKKILFVDDEPLVLQGLKRMLRRERTEWDMTFVESGREALEMMEITSIDVVVSDMRMPGMNGAELLEQVTARHPETVRIILSGYADQDLVLKSIGTAHQYLAKPCDPITLKATIKRATNLSASLRDGLLKRIVSSMDRLPSVPSIYNQIVKTLENPDAGLEEVGNIILQDIGMTAKILKLVNSAFFGLAQEFSDPRDAVSYLGLDIIKALILAIGAFSKLESPRHGRFSMEALWQHSIQTAVAAKAIAAVETTDRKLINEAFVAGMLHDTGKLVMAANFPDKYNRVLEIQQEQRLSSVAAETEVFETDHAAVGGYLLGLWGLPVPVVEAVSSHHSPGESTYEGFSSVTAVYVANALVATANDSVDGDSDPKIDLEYLTDLGLNEHLESWKQAFNNH